MSGTPPVRVQGLAADFSRHILFNTAGQQIPIPATPSVDTLLDITDDQTFISIGLALLNQRFEILPLHDRSVLEFIQQEILKTDTQLLIDEWSFRTRNDPVQDVIGFVQTHHILFFEQSLELIIDFLDNTQIVGLLADGG